MARDASNIGIAALLHTNYYFVSKTNVVLPDTDSRSRRGYRHLQKRLPTNVRNPKDPARRDQLAVKSRSVTRIDIERLAQSDFCLAFYFGVTGDENV